MKKILLVVAVFSLTLNLAAANKKAYVKALDDVKYELKVGDAVMIVDASNGAKVISLKLKDKEILAQHVENAGPFANQYDYGSTFWPSPQKSWNWPPIKTYDSDSYVVKKGKKSIVATSGVDEKYPYRFTKDYAVDKKAGAFVITYQIENPGDKPVNVAPWEITRVHNSGVFFFAAEKENIDPIDKLPLKFEHGLVWCEFSTSRQQRKIFVDSDGWLAFSNDGFLFVKQFENLPKGVTAPGQGEVEVYIHQGEAFMELEDQGAYTEIQPGEKISWTVKWYVRPTSALPVASEQLRDEVLKLVK